MMKFKSKYWHWLSICLLATAVACGDDDETTPDDNEEEEVITTINLTLTATTGDVITASVVDMDGEGGADAVVTDPGPLTLGLDYSLSFELLNETETPAEDITEEIEEEAEEHQFFYVTTGDVITVEITDVESDYAMNMVGDDLPVGLAATVTATAAGPGTLRVVLKHLPALDDGATIQKTGTNTINDGESDFDITFDVTVQ